MTKRYISGILLLSLTTFFVAYFFDLVLTHAKISILDNYFCSRTDTSYNVYVKFIDNMIEVKNNRNEIQSFDYNVLKKKLEGAKKHRLLNSILNRLENKISFKLKVNEKLKICGFYDEGIYFTEAYVFIGDIKNLGLFDFITDPQIQWPVKIKQDKDLIYAVIYIFVKKLFNFYTFKFYNDFVIISDYQQQELYRLDVDYNDIFGINLTSNRNVILYELLRIDDGIIIKKARGKVFNYSVQDIDPIRNTISTILKKNTTIELDLERFLNQNDFVQIKNILDVEKIKEDKNFMNLIDVIKTKVKNLITSK